MKKEPVTEQLFKVTGRGGVAHHGGSGKWVKGRWRSVRGEVIPCENGLHLARKKNLITWLGPEIWTAEYEGDLIDHGDKVVARRARIVKKYDTWNDRTARLFAADCAEKVLPLFEKVMPNDKRVREAIEVARKYANGEATDAELAAARDAARAAARDAAGDAARDAAWAAAWAAARAAARDAAGDAARDAAGDAARDAAWAAAWAAARAAARDAAGDAARDAAGDAAWAAAWAAARAKFMDWATARLFDYLEGRAE